MPNWSLDGYQKILDASARGRKTLIKNAKIEYQEKLNEYNKNPVLCKCCSKTLTLEQVSNKSIYCSRSCSAKINNSKRVRKNIELTCLYCNKKYKTSKNSTGKYCSTQCSASYRKNQKIKDWLNGKHTPSCSAIRRYLKELKEYKCEICNLSVWNNLPIPLEVDHKDGNHKNNQLDNLRLLCPNCHAQTPTYKAKNKGNGREYRRERWKVGKTC